MTIDASKPSTTDREPEQRSARAEAAATSQPEDQGATRTAQILRLADEEAAEVRARATQDADVIREQAHRDAEAVRAQAERDAADVRLAALANAEELRQQAMTEAQDRRAELAGEADELLLSVWWLAERVRVAAGKDPRDLPRIPDDVDIADGTAPVDEPAPGTPANASEETLARHSAMRRAAVAAQRSQRTTEMALQESERTIARARREAEELLNRARAEAERVVAHAHSESEHALVLAERRVETLNRERDGILATLVGLTQQTADLGLQQTSPPTTQPGRQR